MHPLDIEIIPFNTNINMHQIFISHQLPHTSKCINGAGKHGTCVLPLIPIRPSMGVRQSPLHYATDCLKE